MSRDSGFPSMTALLALLAVAGYQNRDKIAEMINGLGQPGAGTGQKPGQLPGGAGAGNGGVGNLGSVLAGTTVGGLLGKGIGELLDQFKQNGHAAEAESWNRTRPNQEIAPPKVKEAIGPQVLDALSKQTGLSPDEILKRLSRELPSAVDRYTPDGRVPA